MCVLKLSVQTVGKGFAFPILRDQSPRGNQGGIWSRNSNRPFGHPPQRLAFGIGIRVSHSTGYFSTRWAVHIQQVWLRALHRSVLLGHSAIFGHKQNNGSSGQPAGGLPLRGGRRWTRGAGESAPHIFEGEGVRGNRLFPRLRRWNFGWGPPGWVCAFAGRGFDTRTCFLLGLPSSLLRGGVGLGSGFSGLPIFLVAVTLDSSGTSVTSWGEGFGFGFVIGVVVALTTRPLGRRDFTPSPGPSARQRARPTELSERQVGLLRRSFGHARTPPLQARLRFLPLYTAMVVRLVVSPAAKALRFFFPRCRASTGEVGAPTLDAPGCVSAVTLRVFKALAALALQWAFWSHVRLHLYSQAAEFGECSHFRHLRPSRHWYNEVGCGRAVLGRVLVATAGS